ncbi:MAG: RluA family pseudouridine synthase [Bacillota bacterium]|nr:RluA family pseudouridine synthase [Bacillota bacterium]
MNNDSFEFYVDRHGDEIKKILKEKYNFSNRLMRKLEESGNIYLNGYNAKLDKNTYIDDVIKVEFEDEENIYSSTKMDLEILYEDEDILGLNKPPFILVHPSKEDRNDTLANGLVWLFENKNISRKIRFINRLDMNTSGVVLIAKNPYGQSILMKEMQKNKVVKKYLALVEGYPDKNEGTIDKPIGLPEGENIKRAVLDSGDYSITKYSVKEKLKNNISLIELKLETGRTHQIRVHMAHIGHPVLGDELYCSKSKLINRQALHCVEINFENTRNHDFTCVKAPLPNDFKKILEDNR